MEQVIQVLFIAAVLGTILYQRRLLDAVISAIENFRGGPPRPTHPLPADDGVLLLRRSRTGRSRQLEI